MNQSDDLWQQEQDPSGTRQLSDYTTIDNDMRITSIHPAAGSTKALRLYLPGGEALVIEPQARIRIGRKDAHGSFIPEIDLTQSHGANLGVSRHHADILYINHEFYLKDMGSMNGSWVNGRQLAAHQLVPIRYGDSIRLGHLIIAVG